MRNVAAFAGFAQTVALDGAGENYGGRPPVIHGGFVGGVNFFRIMAAKAHAAERVIGHAFNHFQQSRVAAEKVLADVGAGFNDEFLRLAIEHFAHAANESAVGILLQKRIPVASPHDFDNVPARAAESCFEFLNDLTIATDGTVKAL